MTCNALILWHVGWTRGAEILTDGDVLLEEVHKMMYFTICHVLLEEVHEMMYHTICHLEVKLLGTGALCV